ncbi:f-box domain containing protein [Drepanopeziza brunnea f. sp. 'multigermtubi' MB_m1]|uniref:F-box domain containing protein n=1 Tax=Marssonina brunnea f. sp. multigermtubi (strain MB_m1) TaxID=1072389 RepID=K1WV15_MARBU|nr:f-box domain containing protein [Drepanopeziza brunnea f. sp. 'multigermtubi' MB_m1]EKD16297.1 f-box domain containing protein [Drepanopeziza brunnea f. sp. 'multigermtubi' MB_m1]
MDSSESDISTDTSDSSSSADSISADSSAQNLWKMSETEGMTTALGTDDSDSDISMSAETDDEQEADPTPSSLPTNPTPQTTEQATEWEISKQNSEASRKRKFSDSCKPPDGQSRNGMANDVRKRYRVDNEPQCYRTPDGRLLGNKSLLPAEIWHHIFSFCPPRGLGRLLQVNKSFNTYLDPSATGLSIKPLSTSALHLLAPDSIWRASRQAFVQRGLPAPLAGKSELAMWKLLCGSACQFCNKIGEGPPSPMDQWHPGPGESGVAPVWLFGIRACGSCLQEHSTKEIDLLLSSTIPSPLMAALPFVFLTNELHLLSAATLQSGQHPPSIQITKFFFKVHVDEIKREFEDVKAMGSATAEEWLKGLDGRGKERRNDAARWERWELGGGMERLRDIHPQQPTNPCPPPITQPKNVSNFPAHPGPIPSFATRHPSHLPHPVQNGFVKKPPARFDSPAQNGFAHFTPRPQSQAKHERTKEEVAELKAARRAEIERRCLLLEPPITPAVLAHMPSFQAAIQIIQPLVDSSWEVLKPRLLFQREDAEQRENERLAQTRVAQKRSDERRFQDLQSRSGSKDLAETEWDNVQAPLRARIAAYADEMIRDGWNGGEKVTYETSPLFAAEVLIYVRKRFFDEVSKEEADVRATGREPETEPLNGPFTRKLILENMKWVFDTKIKPRTEQYRKELFLCNACEYANKYYGFEGVIQHYAAKHTSALSVGSVVVHWKSEWPEIPPFSPNPNSAAAKYYPAAPSASIPYTSTGSSMPQNYGYGGYPPPVSTPMPGANPHVYQESPGPYYGHPNFGDQYSGQQNGPYAPPPQPYQDPPQVYQPPQYSVAPQPSGVPGYNDAPQDYSQNGYGTQYQPPQQDIYASSNPGIMYPSAALEVPGQQASYDSASSQYRSYNQQPTYPTNEFAQPPQKTEQYMAQLQDLARNAREIWNSIGSIKEIPGNLKVYTIIYHVLKRFRESYQEEPPLSMMVDGLTSNKDMRPVRNINGLLCKACTLAMAGSTSAPQKKHFSFPQLVNHFHSVHELGAARSNYGQVPDWTKDMVVLPDLAKLRAVVNAPGMNDKRLALFTEAVPTIIRVPDSPATDLHRKNDPPSEYPLKASSQDNHDNYYTAAKNISLRKANVFDNGEYDPRNPGELLVEPRPQYAPPKQSRQPLGQELPRAERPVSSYQLYDNELPGEPYGNQPDRSINEPRPSSASQPIPAPGYARVISRDDSPVLVERRVRYHDAPDLEYHARREPHVSTYEEPRMVHPERDYRSLNTRSFYSNGREQPPPAIHAPEATQSRPNNAATPQQSRIHDVVAQISQQAQRVREQQPTKEEADGGSEDGELRADDDPKAARAPNLQSEEASNAADRFLEQLRSGEFSAETMKHVDPAWRKDERRPEWDDGRGEGARVYRAPAGPPRQLREGFEEDYRGHSDRRRFVNPDENFGGYIVHERAPAPRTLRTQTFEERHVSTAPEPEGSRGRSPELVDRRYKLNNVIYRDEKQNGQGTHRTPSRYARYASVRLENDRARSRSPVYYKVGTHPGQYREMSPGPHPAHALRPEPVYRSRTPHQGTEDAVFERPPRQEYYRVYADEPRPREPQYTEAFEYVRVSDPQGDYMIRRPVRREPEPVYAAFQDDVYGRPPVYESRAHPPAASRAEPPFYEEEYDPRHPAPPPQHIRY